jgi:hypothetical protein
MENPVLVVIIFCLVIFGPSLCLVAIGKNTNQKSSLKIIRYDNISPRDTSPTLTSSKRETSVIENGDHLNQKMNAGLQVQTARQIRNKAKHRLKNI